MIKGSGKASHENQSQSENKGRNSVGAGDAVRGKGGERKLKGCIKKVRGDGQPKKTNSGGAKEQEGGGPTSPLIPADGRRGRKKKQKKRRKRRV